MMNRRGYIVGYATDTAGYMVVFPDDDGRVSARSPVYSSVNVVPDRGLRPWVADGTGASRPPDSLPVAASDGAELPMWEEARALETDDDVPADIQRQVRVGAVPGDLGSRFSLLTKEEAASLPPGTAIMTKAAAQALIHKAKEEGATIVFDQVNPKEPNSKTARRYEAYKHCRSFADLAAVGRQRFQDGAPKLRTGPSTGDLVFAVMRGQCTFVSATDPTLHLGGEDAGLLPAAADDGGVQPTAGPQEAHMESTTAVDNEVAMPMVRSATISSVGAERVADPVGAAGGGSGVLSECGSHNP